MKMLKILKFFFFLFFILQMTGTITLAIFPLTVRAQSYNSLDYTPQIKIPVSGSGFDQASTPVGSYDETKGVMTSDLLAKYIKALYDYGMMVCGILAAIVLMGGGVLWLISAGDSSKVSQAKELISGSITGMVILFSSWIILNTINPDLLKLKPIITQVVKKINIVCCQYNEGDKWKETADLTTDKDCAANGGKAYTSVTDVLGNVTPYAPDGGGRKCAIPGCCIGRENGNPNGKIMKCTNTVHSNCSDPSYFKEMNCSLIPEEMGTDAAGKVYNHGCKGLTDKCATAKDGDDCYDGQYSSQGACYNKLCWLGKGQIGEPCGTELYSKCTVDDPEGGRNCNQDQNGRSCIGGGNNVWCCKFKSNGLRLNN